MANQKTQSILNEVLGDPQGIFTNPDPLQAMHGDMPSWMTENLLDGPVFKKAEATQPTEPEETESTPED